MAQKAMYAHHYEATVGMATSREVTAYLEQHLKVGDVIRYMDEIVIVMATAELEGAIYFWVRSLTAPLAMPQTARAFHMEPVAEVPIHLRTQFGLV